MEKLIGKWALESSDKFDDFLKELGVPEAARKLLETKKAVTSIVKEDSKKFKLELDFSVKQTELEFELDVEFEQKSHDGLHDVNTLFKLLGDKLVQEVFDAKTKELKMKIIREVIDDKLVIVYQAKTITAKRIFIRA